RTVEGEVVARAEARGVELGAQQGLRRGDVVAVPGGEIDLLDVFDGAAAERQSAAEVAVENQPVAIAVAEDLVAADPVREYGGAGARAGRDHVPARAGIDLVVAAAAVEIVGAGAAMEHVV